MSLEHEAVLNPLVPTPGSPTVVRKLCWNRRCVLYLTGPLRAPLNGELQDNIRALIRRGERNIVLDLSWVPRIDAAGVGDLVRAYNMASAAHAVFHIAHATAWVQAILERVGLFEILSEA